MEIINIFTNIRRCLRRVRWKYLLACLMLIIAIKIVWNKSKRSKQVGVAPLVDFQNKLDMAPNSVDILLNKTELPEEVDPRIKLDMAPNSVDDMYDGCERKIENLILEQYLPEEQNNKNFKLAWEEAEKYYNKRWKKSQLDKNLIKALYAYTLNQPPLHDEFNKAVREQKAQYQTDFHYHTLHFYLTMALRSLNNRSKECVTSYRRTKSEFQKDVVNNTIRFGSFTSSSKGGYSDKWFGTESCFEIYTCFGADISIYSRYYYEREVLIPPYEVFKVTEIEEESTKKLPCKVVYKLRSTGETHSDLNCDLLKPMEGL